ncbi:LLM class flavin-dependent oxidoreductase [Geodermatophilus ruber]|uniref:Flavin-dependent oxidoreductase, luciferase family (Includes alkanesulfonate monooxygenase SsuD and methylene tetrahydromethanopterin reductase) n=1 Tax=Geodermatophilus ruber TaxID=504800 RepID=A0A1I4I5J5_9ACTN|nr:LLM class flavin-dependent oxidoreductase [Geodermatophilus ruber]SFL49500.1 Flavin-dependent oxidoreductase, luciferase family (includes alkanesulfonate monooxygenase SsuD and methylene tetrahydromethanopterin reductase) [Geodermatophilus ruber]
MAQLGVALLTFAPARTREFVDLARCAEQLGYDACFTTESLTDTLSIDLAILLGTSRIRVGSYVTVSYLRHPVIAAQMAVTASDLSGGRFVLGVGLGHPMRLRALGVPVGRPSVDLPAYVRDVKAVLSGRGRQRYPDLPPQTYRDQLLDFRRPEYPVPVYTAAVGARMAEAGAAVSDGVMAWLVPRSGVGALAAATARAGERTGRPAPPVEVTVHAFVTDDLAAAREAARAALSYWVGLPAYNRALAAAGHEAEAAAIAAAFAADDRAGLRAAVSDRLIDEYCLVGPPGRCREQLVGWHGTEAATVAVVPHPVAAEETYVAGVRRTVVALAPT